MHSLGAMVAYTGYKSCIYGDSVTVSCTGNVRDVMEDRDRDTEVCQPLAEL